MNAFQLIIEQVLSCLRNIQIDQSFKVGMELIQEFSKLLWDEDVISCILPYINQFVIKNDRNSEQIIALRLFFKLIDRIKYIPKPLAN